VRVDLDGPEGSRRGNQSAKEGRMRRTLSSSSLNSSHATRQSSYSSEARGNHVSVFPTANDVVSGKSTDGMEEMREMTQQQRRRRRCGGSGRAPDVQIEWMSRAKSARAVLSGKGRGRRKKERSSKETKTDTERHFLTRLPSTL
jgi:hypothetical protein